MPLDVDQGSDHDLITFVNNMFNQEFFHACIGLKKKIVPLKVNMYFPFWNSAGIVKLNVFTSLLRGFVLLVFKALSTKHTSQI